MDLKKSSVTRIAAGNLQSMNWKIQRNFLNALLLGTCKHGAPKFVHLGYGRKDREILV